MPPARRHHAVATARAYASRVPADGWCLCSSKAGGFLPSPPGRPTGSSPAVSACHPTAAAGGGPSGWSAGWTRRLGFPNPDGLWDPRGHGIAVSVATNAGALGVPHPVVASYPLVVG